MTYMPPFMPDASDRSVDREDHGWIVSHMISLIEYCERENLAEAERVLTEATERLAPILNGHRLARLRESKVDAGEEQLPCSANLLEMSFARASRSDARV